LSSADLASNENALRKFFPKAQLRMIVPRFVARTKLRANISVTEKILVTKSSLRGDKVLSESFDAGATNNCLNLGRIR
jgi:hypothetical protein